MSAHPSASTEESGTRTRGGLALETARSRLVETFQRLENAPTGLFSEGTCMEVARLRRKFEERRFHLVLLGQFKRGKTTLLNSLIGMDLLPTGVLPLTSIVTIVQYGPTPCVRVRFADGAIREISPSKIADYVTERGNPRNQKGVADVEVFHPTSPLKDGLCLIDTPGIGSIFEHNTQAAYQFVPRADAAIFVVSPEAPLSRSELEFLHHIRAHVEKVFFVLNKANQASEGERKEILDFARQEVQGQMAGSKLRFFSVSVRQALAATLNQDSAALLSSSLPALLDALKEFLATHSGRVLLRSAGGALLRTVRDRALVLELECRAQALTAEELQQKMQIIETAWQSLHRREREADPILRAEIRALEESLARGRRQFVEAGAPRLRQEMQSKLCKHRRMPKHPLVRQLEETLRGKIAETFEERKILEEKTIHEAFEALTARLSTDAATTVDRIQQVAAEQFGFSWRPTPLPDRLSLEGEFSIHIDEMMNWGVGQFPFLLPKPLFTRYLARRLEEVCALELYRNAGRLGEDVGNQLDKSCQTYLRALDRHVQEAGEAVLGALARAAGQKKSCEATARREQTTSALHREFLQEMDAEISAIQTGCEPAGNQPPG